MTIKELKGLIKNEKDDTEVLLHVWNINQGESTYFFVNHALNNKWQKKNNIFLLTKGFMTPQKMRSL